MELLKYVLPIAMATCGFCSLNAAQDPTIRGSDGYSTTVEARESDTTALKDFIATKSGISIQEKGGNLMISGDIRGEWNHMHARTKGKSQRGRSSANLNPPQKPHAPFPKDEMDVECNLMFDYRADSTWGRVRLQMDNLAGIRERNSDEKVSSHKNTLFGSGTLDNLALRQAYFGYNILEQGTSRFDVELGRRRLYDVFDSKIQFSNYFDGILLKYANSFEGAFDFRAMVSGFVIDQTVHHYGWVGELDFMNIADLGLDLKYSFITWDKEGMNRYGHRHPHGARFNISQFTAAYNFSPELIGYKSQLYGAFLMNHDGHGNRFTHHKKANKGFYVGVHVGELKKQNDWSVDLNYQWVQAQAIPESDVHGIGIDNPRYISFYKDRSQGYANYKGYQLNGLYNLTDNLTLEATWESVRRESRKIGGRHHSNNLELAAIYSF